MTDLRESVARAPDLLVAMAKAHDQEAAAQKGEPSPWDVSIFGEPDKSFVSERVVAMQCALRAVADAGFVIVPKGTVEGLIGHAEWVAAEFDIHWAHLADARAALQAALKDMAGEG